MNLLLPLKKCSAIQFDNLMTRKGADYPITGEGRLRRINTNRLSGMRGHDRYDATKAIYIQQIRMGSCGKNYTYCPASDRSRFFSLILFGDPLRPALAEFGMTPLLAAVYVGAMQNIFSKSAKYSLFDPCKEMAYIPLDEDTNVKGKAAIDVVCNPLGKSGGALIQQFMILTFGSLANSTSYLGGIFLMIVFTWLSAAKSLDTQFTALRRGEELEKKMEREAVNIPILSEPRNDSVANSSLQDPASVDSTGSSSETSTPRNI